MVFGGGLTVPPGDRRSVASSASNRTDQSARQWDDPPEEEPAGGAGADPSQNGPTMVFVKRVTVHAYAITEIVRLEFTPTNTHVAAIVARDANASCVVRPDAPCLLAA